MPTLTNNASNLPGMAVEFKDGGLVLRQDAAVAASTRSILLIGTAIDGPVMQPVAIDATTAEVVFGKSVDLNGKPNGASLPEAFSQVYKEGCRDVRMMRISGAPAAATISGTALTAPSAILKQETLGTLKGNDALTFQLDHKLVDEGSIAVFANGNAIPNTAFTADHELGRVFLKADMVTANSDIKISYSYYEAKSEITTEAKTLSALLKATLANRPLVADGAPDNKPAPVVSIAGVPQVATTHYTIDEDTNVITFVNKRVSNTQTTALVSTPTTQTTAWVPTSHTQTTAPVAGSTYQLVIVGGGIGIGSIQTVLVDGGAVLPGAGAGKYTVDLATGIMTFGTAFAGTETISVTYVDAVTTYQLATSPLASVTSVTVGGSAITAGTGAGKYLVDTTTGLITFGTPQDPMATISVVFVNLTTTYQLATTPLISVSSVTYNNNPITAGAGAGKYTVDLTTGVITFGTGVDPSYSISVVYLTDTAALVGDIATVNYWYASGNTRSFEQNSAMSTPPTWKAPAASPQLFSLSKTTTSDKLRVYINGREIADRTSYSLVSASGVSNLSLIKSNYNINDLVEVSYEYSEVTQEIPTILLETVSGGKMYNESSFSVAVTYAADGVTAIDKTFTISKPVSKKATSEEKDLTFKASVYPTYYSLVQAINNDALNVGGGQNVFLANTEYPDYKTLDIPVTAKTFFTGGDDGLGLTKQRLFEKLSGKRDDSGLITEVGAYQLLQNYTSDFIIPCGVYADDPLIGKYDSFAYELAMLCAVASQTHLTHGIIQLKPPVKTDLLSIENWVQNAESLSNLYFMRTQDGSFVTDSDGNPFDLGGYISVIAGPELTYVSQRMGTFNDVGTYKYASIMTTLKASSSPTNKVINTAYGMRYSFSVSQLNRLAAKRFVTFQRRISDNAIATTDGVTSAKFNSDYSRVVNVNIVRDCLAAIYKVAEPYIGEPMSVSTNNALSSAISKKLTEFADSQSGIIETYSFNLVANPQDKLVGDSKIELSIVPLGERRRITVVVGLRPSL